MHLIETSILNTLSYSDIFSYPLTLSEIHHRLIFDKPVPIKTCSALVNKLHEDGKICKTGNYYYLKNRAITVKLRQKHQAFSRSKRLKAKEIAGNLCRLPYVKAVFLTGAVAVRNASRLDDIDILIITSDQSLWTSRILVTAWLEFFRHRRHRLDKSAVNKICPNLFLTLSNLTVPVFQQNLYTAYEVIQADPISDPNNVHALFLSANRWISKYLPNIQIPDDLHQEDHKTSPSWLESVAYKLQLTYMKPHLTREFVTDSAAYFHPRDTAGIVLKEYYKKIGFSKS